MSIRVTAEDARYFRLDLWKDERTATQSATVGAGEFPKFCFTPEEAAVEFTALELLSAVPGEQLVPRPLRLSHDTLVIERIDGIRLFDLIRMLRALELRRRDGIADLARQNLLRRSRQRLAKVQRALLGAAGQIPTTPYPLEQKLTGLLELLTRVLGVETGHWHAEAAAMSDYWTKECSLIPFRDATTKNMLVAAEPLAVSADVSPDDRLARLDRMLDTEPASFWQEVPIIDVDFSSIVHLTAPEDDPISLHCHEWTYQSCPVTPEAFLLLPDLFFPDERRSAVTMLVRLLRFGGRKMAYRLINSQGFGIRFQYDNPAFYFSELRSICRALDATLEADYPRLLACIDGIGTAFSSMSTADESYLEVDHFRRIFREMPARFWQENPLERD